MCVSRIDNYMIHRFLNLLDSKSHFLEEFSLVFPFFFFACFNTQEIVNDRRNHRENNLNVKGSIYQVNNSYLEDESFQSFITFLIRTEIVRSWELSFAIFQSNIIIRDFSLFLSFARKAPHAKYIYGTFSFWVNDIS